MDARITISGNVGSDIGYRIFKGSFSEIPFASFRLAMTPRMRNAQGWEDGQTTWISVNCARSLAENVYKSVKKGDPVIVEGRLRTQRWVDKETGEAKEREVIEANVIGHNLMLGTTVFVKTIKSEDPVAVIDVADVIEAANATSDEHQFSGSPMSHDDPYADAFVVDSKAEIGQ